MDYETNTKKYEKSLAWIFEIWRTSSIKVIEREVAATDVIMVVDDVGRMARLLVRTLSSDLMDPF